MCSGIDTFLKFFLIFECLTSSNFQSSYFYRICSMIACAWKMSVFGVFHVLFFRHSDWIRRDTQYLSIFSQNVVKYRPENLRMRTLSTQCASAWCYSLVGTVYFSQAANLNKLIERCLLSKSFYFVMKYFSGTKSWKMVLE